LRRRDRVHEKQQSPQPQPEMHHHKHGRNDQAVFMASPPTDALPTEV
jgi:hypothetical protein